MVAAGFSLRKILMQNRSIKERKHRLPRELNTGRTSAAFTLCIQGDQPLFMEQGIVNAFTEILIAATASAKCIVPVYCFMPDHLHLIVTGTVDDADLWKAIVAYKQKTGYWLSQNKPAVTWQKDFYYHIIRSDENLVLHIRYVLDNPVRTGITASWQEYPYKGSVGYDLSAIASGTM